MLNRVNWVWVLVVVTALVWLSRLRNIWSDDDLTTGGQVVRTVMALIFLAFAVALTIRLLRAKPIGLLLAGFVIWTVGFWLVRGIGIIVDDHELGFTIVHTVLMIGSITLALLAGRSLRVTTTSDTAQTASRVR